MLQINIYKHKKLKTVLSIKLLSLIALCAVTLTGCASSSRKPETGGEIKDDIKSADKQNNPAYNNNQIKLQKPTSPTEIYQNQTKTSEVMSNTETQTVTQKNLKTNDYENEQNSTDRSVTAQDYPAIPLKEASTTTENPSGDANNPSEKAYVSIPILQKPGMAEQLVSVNFDQVDIRTMLKTIGEITGINFVIDETVQGKVSVMSPTKIKLSELYNVLQSILEVKGYAAIPSGGIIKIVPRKAASRCNLQVRLGSEPSLIPDTDELITQIIPLKYAEVDEVVQIIKPILGQSSQPAAYSRTNSVIITDTSSNIRHIAKIIKKIDVKGSEEQVCLIELKYASAQVLAGQIKEIMKQEQTSSRQVAHAQNQGHIRILPDARTNSLLAVADAKNIQIIKTLASKLDKKRPRGTTNIHVVYLKNALSTPTAESLTKTVADLRVTSTIKGIQQVRITSDEDTNALIIAASQQDFEVISEIIEKLDIVRKQVAVEMLIAEISENSLKQIGIDWATLDEAVSGSVRGFASTNFGPRVDFAQGDLEGFSVGAFKVNDSTTKIGPILSALETLSGVNILSTPHIVTLNHQKAKIIVGQNRPFVTDSRITETDPSTPTVIRSFEYKDVGITLEITPHISQGELVRLEIDSKFTKLLDTVAPLTIETPTTAKREAQTVVSMKSGSTVVIGGLIRDDKDTVVKKIPLIGDIPLLGELFKFKKDLLQKTNLLIFITPQILNNQQDMEKMTERKQNQLAPELNKLPEAKLKDSIRIGKENEREPDSTK